MKIGDMLALWAAVLLLWWQAGLSWWWFGALYAGGWAVNLAVRAYKIRTVKRALGERI